MNTTTIKTSLYDRIDPKLTVTLLLISYNLLGIVYLGFNRTFEQVFLTCAATVLVQFLLEGLFNKRWVFSQSALITGLGLAILVNYGHSYLLLLVPVFLGIGSKFLFTFNGKHIFNPGLMGVVLSLLITNELISPAPAYQWNQGGLMAFMIALPALFLVMPKINRHWLVIAWLGTFTAQIILRSILIQHYLPWSTLFFGTLTSPSFFLFTFFMITDPGTTPGTKKEQIKVGVILGVLDLFFHLVSSYHTFFYAALVLGSYKLFKVHTQEMIKEKSFFPYISQYFFKSGHYLKTLILFAIMGSSVWIYKNVLQDNVGITKAGFRFESVSSLKTQFDFGRGNIDASADPRVQHMAKWLLSITDGVAVVDFDNDGLQDIFFANPHKAAKDRNALFRNLGEFKFERVKSEELSFYGSSYKDYGAANNAIFVDFDNDGDKDLYLMYAFGAKGTSRLFKNLLNETGTLVFKNITDESGLRLYSNSATANFFDYNKDGKLDLFLGNTIATHLKGYDKPTELNYFELPAPEYEGDRRMLHFMHESWHMASNGGANYLFENLGDTFKLLDSKVMGFPETRWSMAIATADFNQDGWTDLYVANDFGPDDLYYNREGKSFENIKGEYFGEIGKDTYKGMNATILDFDRNGYMDVYISNVHHALQAEGSLLWSFHKNKDKDSDPYIKEVASFTGALNENRFGWGAGSGDFNNDGWIDLAQANGMVDDIWDKESDDCPDYWYVNEKLARSPPEIHTFIDNWGDIRGKCIYGKEKNRLYLNRGTSKKPQFVDIANQIGMTQEANWRGMAIADFNNDGKLDLVASSLRRNPLVFKNLGGDSDKNNWIGFDLVSNSPKCNKDAVGSRVELTFMDSKGVEQRQTTERVVANGFSAQSDGRIHFGLGEKGTPLKLKITWCGGDVLVYKHLEVNAYQKMTYE